MVKYKSKKYLLQYCIFIRKETIKKWGYPMANEFYITEGNDGKKYKVVKGRYSLSPSYYNDFQCIAQDCKLSCCAGWNITMNKKDYLSLRRQSCSETLQNNIKENIRKKKFSQKDVEYAEIRLRDDNSCPLLSEEGLCSLQLECGYNALPKVCQTFPRGEDFVASGYLEKSLTPACEAVLELLWNLPSGIDFVEEPLPKPRWSEVRVEIPSLYVYFDSIRELCIDLLQDRRFTVAQRILLMGVLLEKLPEADNEATADADILQWLSESKALLTAPNVADIASNLMPESDEIATKFLIQNIKTISTFETGNVSQAIVLKDLLNLFILNAEDSDEVDHSRLTVNFKAFQQAKQNFSETFEDLEYFFENLAVSVFFRAHLPYLSDKEELWKGYVNFCNTYSLFRFTAIASCYEIVPEQKDKMFQYMLLVGRTVLHSFARQLLLRDLFFKNESSSLAHMAILLSQ